MTDGVAAKVAFVAHAPEAVITDWMVPGIDGPEFVRRIRDGEQYCDVVMLTRSPTTITH